MGDGRALRRDLRLLLGDRVLREAQERDDIGELSDIGRLCLAFMKGVSLPMLLRYEDRDSMAHSIEARVPFLDHRLVDFTIGLWDRHKIVGGDTKRVLRDGLAGVLPEKIRHRHDKLGFTGRRKQRDRFCPLRSSQRLGITLVHSARRVEALCCCR